MVTEAPLLAVEDLAVHFPVRGGVFQRRQNSVKAVDGVSFTIRRGETLSLVGESGCGKSTTGLALLGLVKPTGGRISFDGHEIRGFTRSALKDYRRRMQIVFQDPFSSLNPRHRVRDAIRAGLDIHGVGTKEQREADVADLMKRVGLRPDQADSFPHQFSGGQRQRIGIARALAVDPQLIVADEPVSALDVSVQAQVINLLEDLQDRFGLTYLVVAHDLAVVRHISDRVGVMYLGALVEEAAADDLYAAPMHPYTRALMSAVPVPDPVVEDRRERILLNGDLPSPANPPKGCRFHTRCPWRQPTQCDTDRPVLRVVSIDGVPETHRVACHFAEGIASGELQPHKVEAEVVDPHLGESDAHGSLIGPATTVEVTDTP
ncbi:MAG: ATP-binding cassette domain-containing protein [Tetrasphaera sp.]|nr:ATP-binding cassette domain-containing protein [Tetrasphaera sp.]